MSGPIRTQPRAAVARDCPACRSQDTRAAAGATRSAIGGRVAVFDCGGCGSQFADVQDADGIYDQVYESEDTPGYSRYAEHAEGLDADGHGLDWLRRRDSSYALVAHELDGSDPTEIIEIGCGLGYLTHALRDAGHDAVGLDISTTAVHAARDRFGDHFTAGTVDDLDAGAAEIIVALEVIEHVEDPTDFLRHCLDALAPGGRVILTTPNRSYLPSWLRWRTDAPPVHLHWFTPTGLAAAAAAAGGSTRFVALDQLDVHENQLVRLARIAAFPLFPTVAPGAGSPGGNAVVAGASRLGRLARGQRIRTMCNRIHRLIHPGHHRIGAVVTRTD